MRGKVKGKDVLNSPVDQADDTTQDAKCDRTARISLPSLGRLRNATRLADHIDQRHDQRPETDTAKRVRQRPPGSPSRGTRWHSSRFPCAEEPRSVDAGDDGVDGVLQPFGDPI